MTGATQPAPHDLAEPGTAPTSWLDRRSAPWAAAGGWILALALAMVQMRIVSGHSWLASLLRAVVDLGPWALLTWPIAWLAGTLHNRARPLRIVAIHLAAALACLCASELMSRIVLMTSDAFGYHVPPPVETMVPLGPAGRPLPDRLWPPPPFAGLGPPPGFPPPGTAARPRFFVPRPPPPSDFSNFGDRLLRRGAAELPIYLAIAGLAHMILFYRSVRLRERQVVELEHRLLTARTDMLRLQLEPHFLYNTLNAVSTLVHVDPDRADDLIVRLSTLLRRLLALRDEQMVPLAEELDVLRAYLEIEQIRFGDRLSYREHVDPALLDRPVPLMLLQPLAENAIRHGIEPLGRPGTVELAVRQEPGRLVLELEDDGLGIVGRGQAGTAGTGVGLANARARLALLYREQASLEVTRRPTGGTRVRVVLPETSRSSAPHLRPEKGPTS